MLLALIGDAAAAAAAVMLGARPAVFPLSGDRNAAAAAAAAVAAALQCRLRA
jgi:hypothetical protein